MIPRVTRRLNDFERRTMVKSGAVFIFSVEESGIKRWTEGLAWSQSRISGNFLVSIARLHPSHGTVLTHSSALSGGRGSDNPHESTHRGPAHVPTPWASARTTAQLQTPWAGEEGDLFICLRQFSSEANGQQTITVKIDGSDYHLISYYTQEDLAGGLLRRPTSHPDLMAIEIPPELTRSTNFRYPPNLEEAHDTASSHR